MTSSCRLRGKSFASAVLANSAFGCRRHSEFATDVGHGRGVENAIRYRLLDSPLMLGVSDASVLASEVDETIIVVQHRRFPRCPAVNRVKQAVIGVGGNVLGVVLNN